MDGNNLWDAEGELGEEGDISSIWYQPRLKMRKPTASECFLSILYFDGSQWYHISALYKKKWRNKKKFCHCLSFANNSSWIGGPFQEYALCALYVMLRHPLYAFKTCSGDALNQLWTERMAWCFVNITLKSWAKEMCFLQSKGWDFGQ